MLYIAKLITKIIASIVAGALGGWICGFIILSFGVYIGQSGNHGGGTEEGFGYWNPSAMFGLAGFYGTFIGILTFPVGYLMFLQKVPIDKALRFTLMGTLGGGLCGALLGPPTAAIFGIIGFFIASSIAGRNRPNSN
jgi:hypothetical protein